MIYEGTSYIRHRAPSRLRPILTRVLRFSRFPMLIGALVLVLASPASGQSRQAPLSATTAVSVSQLPSMLETAHRWWTQPVVGARCSSPFNQARVDGPNGSSYAHAGRDLVRYYGAPVRAVANGTVTRVTAPSGYKGGYGYRVQIRHGKGQYETLYAHMIRGSITVHVGQWVRMGTVIGRMGHTGWAYGTHTHFEVRSWGTPINPDNFMRYKGVRLC